MARQRVEDNKAASRRVRVTFMVVLLLGVILSPR
jgi:hypothetical protein